MRPASPVVPVTFELQGCPRPPEAGQREAGRRVNPHDSSETFGCNHTEPYLSNVVPGTLLDNGWTCPAVSFLPVGSPIGMEEEGCKESPGCGASLNEESGNQNGCFRWFSQRAVITNKDSHFKEKAKPWNGCFLRLVSLPHPNTCFKCPFHFTHPDIYRAGLL